MVRAEFELRGRLPFLKDFEQLDSVRWQVNGTPVEVELERMKDNIAFRGLPASGRATVVYTLNCVTEPAPGYRKRLIGRPGVVMARGGLFLCLVGSERDNVDVRWILPSGWELGLGREGLQPWLATQASLWVASENPSISRMVVQGNTFRLIILDGVGQNQREKIEEATKAVFEYALKTFGNLNAWEFGLAVFPRGALGGGTTLGTTIATEDDLLTAVHELLHLWTNFQTPAWFREGVHTYMAARILQTLGILNQEQLGLFLRLCLDEHKRVVEREGRLSTLAESSRNYDRNAGGGDMYGLMPVFAYRLDREIEKSGAARTGVGGTLVSGLERVYAVVCRDRKTRFDLLDLIRRETGYDARELFREYFEKPVTNVEALLRD